MLVVLTGVIGAEASSAAPLPEGRVYERVSAPAKRLGDVEAGVFSSDDGNTVVYASGAAGDDDLGAQGAVYTLARRSSTGWQRQSASAYSVDNIDDDSGGNNVSNPLAFSSDFSRSIYHAPFPLSTDDADGSKYDLFRVDVGTGRGTLLSRGETSPDSDPGGNDFIYVGASEDLSRVYFQSRGRALLTGAPPSAVYEWQDGTVRVASVLPDGTTVNGFGAPASTGPGATPGPASAVQAHRGSHSVSADGSRLYFSISDADGAVSEGPLYLRDGQTTVPVSASQRSGSGGGVADAQFVFASTDGGRAYFVSDEQLTDDAPAGPALYRYVVDTHALEFVTATPGAVLGPISLPMASDDGSHFYFSSTDVLAPGGQAGMSNAYVWTAEAGVRFVAAFSDVSSPSRISRGGHFALYTSYDSIGGAANGGNQAIYRYDADTGALDCASCRPDGGTSAGQATLDRDPVFLYPTPDFVARSRNLSDSGQVFFSTSDRAVPDDRNSAYDVYEYTGGRPYLLSSGRSAHDSIVSDNSDDGRDVFFTTRDSLVPDDDDGGTADLYDARVGGGGFPVAPPVPAPCVGDACRPQPVPTPALGAPGSAALVGPGNVRPPSSTTPKPARILSVGTLDARQRRSLVRGRAVGLAVRVRGGGLVQATIVTRTGGSRRVLGRARRKVHGTTTVKVPLRLSTSGRRQLRGDRRLRATVEVRLSGTTPTVRKTISLVGATR